MRDSKKLVIIALILLLAMLSVMYISLRTDYLLQNQTLQVALERQRLYMDKYSNCLNTEAEMIKWKMEKYEKAIKYYQRVYAVTIDKYKTLPVALGGGK